MGVGGGNQSEIPRYAQNDTGGNACVVRRFFHSFGAFPHPARREGRAARFQHIGADTRKTKSDSMTWMKLASQNEEAIRRALLAWFRRNARSLPWRKSRDPYVFVLSEAMLQQTQVAIVNPYYQRFLEAFPTIEDLARAPLERVLELWSGLGYYRRARYLHQAAKELVRRFAGAFPADYEQIRSLPGIGDYTARAVLSIAFDLPYTLWTEMWLRPLASGGARG